MAPRVVVNDLNGEAADAVAKEVDGEAAVFDVTDAAAFDARRRRRRRPATAASTS